MKRLLTIVTALLIASGSLASDKKEKRKARKAAAKAEQASPAEVENYTPKLAPIGIAPEPEVNQRLRLKAEDVPVVAARIDQVIAAKLKEHGQQMNEPCDDATFVRRVYLNIIGRIPSVEEAQAFTRDSSPNKRAELIDELLVSDGYRSHQFNWLADMLRHKSGIKRYDFAHYERWLKDQIATNRPWDEMVHDMLTAEGSLATSGPSGYLLRDAGMPLDGLSNTVTLFLGANVACAQCHDHPLADWTQREFLEMAAFFGATDVSSRDPRKIGNKVKDGNLTKQDGIKAVAQSMARVKTMPKNAMVYPHDYAYDDVKPGSPVKPGIVYWQDRDSFYPRFNNSTPKVLRQNFADWLTHKDNPRFAVAIGNRLWKRAFGIAIQEPIEDLDDLSRAENPALLQLVGNFVVRTGFDLREVQRMIYNTKAFQAKANVMPPDAEVDDYLFAGPVVRRATAEQVWDSAMILVAGTVVDGARIDRSHAVTRFAQDFDDMSLSALKKTTLVMKKAGYLDTEKFYAKNNYVGAGFRKNSGRDPILRASEMEQPSRGGHFLELFGQSSREIADDGSLEGNIPQSLMLMNGKVQKAISDPGSRLQQKLGGMRKEAAVQYLYQSFYSRGASDGEIAAIRRAMKDGTTITDLAWVLFNTPEFLFIK
jgi:hypothetical protein